MLPVISIKSTIMIVVFTKIIVIEYNRIVVIRPGSRMIMLLVMNWFYILIMIIVIRKIIIMNRFMIFVT